MLIEDECGCKRRQIMLQKQNPNFKALFPLCPQKQKKKKGEEAQFRVYMTSV